VSKSIENSEKGRRSPPQWAKSPKKQGMRLIWHSKYSAMLSKIHSSRLFFGDFAYWVGSRFVEIELHATV